MEICVIYVYMFISRGHRQLRQLGGFLGVGAIVASFVCTECPIRGGYVGDIRNTLEKGCRLQDWGKLKKYVPIHKQGDVCPNGVPALVERDNNDDNSDSA